MVEDLFNGWTVHLNKLVKSVCYKNVMFRMFSMKIYFPYIKLIKYSLKFSRLERLDSQV